MKKVILFFIVIFVLSGCTPTPKVKVMRYSTQELQPTNEIEVLHATPVGREYVVIGEVSIAIKKSTKENAVAHLNEKAKTLGANAIIIMGERSKGSVIMPVGTLAVALPMTELYAIAIKYK